MRNVRWVAVSVVSLAALAACGGQQTGGTDTMPSTPPSAVAGPVTIERTGGIAGMNQSIEIAADGTWVYTDRRRNTSERGTLTDAQRASLLALVGTPGFAEQLLSLSPPPPCADGFHYVITVGGMKGSFDDCGTDDHPAVMAVIAAISDASPL